MEANRPDANSDNAVDEIDELNRVHFEKIYGVPQRAPDPAAALAAADDSADRRWQTVKAEALADRARQFPGDAWSTVKAALKQGVESLRRLG